MCVKCEESELYRTLFLFKTGKLNQQKKRGRAVVSLAFVSQVRTCAMLLLLTVGN